MSITLKARQLRTNALPSGWTHARAQTGLIASYFNLAGVESYATTDEPRFNYDRTTLARLGLMIERAGGNDFQRSLALNDAYWNATSQVSPTAVAGGYDNANTAFSFTEANATLITNGFAKFTSTNVVSAPCISARLKYGTRRWYEMTCVFASGTRRADMDLLNGTIANRSGVAFDGLGAINEGNGWIRYYVSRTGAQTLNQFYLTPRTNNTGGQVTGNGTDVTYCQRPQIEPGTFPSSTVNTTTAGITRGADIVSIPTPPVDTTQSFVMVINFSALPGAPASCPVLFNSDGVEDFSLSSEGPRVVIVFDATDNTVYGWHPTEGDLGVIGAYDPMAVSLKFGIDAAGSYANACFSEVGWYQGRPTDAQKQALAAGIILGDSDISIARMGVANMGVARSGVARSGIISR
jgi:hypothetical protein